MLRRNSAVDDSFPLAVDSLSLRLRESRTQSERLVVWRQRPFNVFRFLRRDVLSVSPLTHLLFGHVRRSIAAMGKSYFAIVGRRDARLYDWVSHPTTIPTDDGATSSTADRTWHLRQFVAHAALDLVDHQAGTTSVTLLRNVDSHGEWRTSAFMPHGPVRLLLLQDAEMDSGIQQRFFIEANELVARLIANPFTKLDAPVESEAFRAKMRALCLKHLGGGASR